MPNYMFRPSSGHHQVLYKNYEENICYLLYCGSDISDRPGGWNGITKVMVVILAYILYN
jgi:hypothetical protein